jgi:hypothetical protein
MIACQWTDLTWQSGGIINYGGGSGYPSTKLYDTTNSFNMTTSRYTAPCSGYYLIMFTANGKSDGVSASDVPRAYPRINGSYVANALHIRGNFYVNSGGDLDQRTFSAPLYLNGGDYVDVYVGAGAFDTFGANYFAVYMLG